MRTVVVTSFDENYVDYSRVMIAQLNNTYRGTKESEYQGQELLDVICLVPSSLMHLEQNYINSVDSSNLNISFRSSKNFEHISSTTNTLELGNNSYISSHANIRIFLGSMLPDYDRVIYIDPDVFINRSIYPLIKMPMVNKFMAWVECNYQNYIIFEDYDTTYFNAGVFIADLNFWREEEIEDKIIKWLVKQREYWGRPTTYPDQDALNFVFRNYLAPLHISTNLFNYLYDTTQLLGECEPTDPKRIAFNPMIIHFVGHEKPWSHPNTTKWARKWNEVFKDLKVFDYKEE